MSNFNDDWLSVVNGILDKISDFADDAADKFNIDHNVFTRFENARKNVNTDTPPANNAVYDKKKAAEELACQKIKWWRMFLKFAGCFMVLPFSVSILVSGLSEAAFICAFTSTVAAIGFGTSLGLLLSGSKDREARELIKRYLPLIDKRPEISVAYLSHILDVKPKKIKRDLKKLLNLDVLPDEAYYNNKMDILVLDGYIEAPSDNTESTDVEDEPEEGNMPCNLDSWIKQFVYLNREIKDDLVSMKLDMMTEYVRKIAVYVKDHPECEKKLRTFNNYYLPTTVKLMDAYKTIENMGDVGTNVIETKARIENSLDSLVLAYKKQLDSLYSAEAIDISGDIDVLESLMNRNGINNNKK